MNLDESLEYLTNYQNELEHERKECEELEPIFDNICSAVNILTAVQESGLSESEIVDRIKDDPGISYVKSVIRELKNG